MAKWAVTIPCTMSVCVEVEADNAKDAIRKSQEVDFTVSVTDNVDLIAFETHERVVEGNVFYGVQTEIEAEEIE